MSNKIDNNKESIEVETIEIDEDDVYAYLYDEDDIEIGFSVIDGEGKEKEYYYADPKANKKGSSLDDEIKQTASEIGGVYHEGHEVLVDLKDAILDIQDSFKDIVKNN